jgi:hypothetical protein
MRRSIEARAARAFVIRRRRVANGPSQPGRRVVRRLGPLRRRSARGRARLPASLFHRGYLLQLDVVFARPAPLTVGFGTPVTLLQTAGVEIVGGALTGSLYALGTLFLAGFARVVLL